MLGVEEVPDPTCPREGAVVRIEAAGVNRLDLDERAGTSGFTLNPEHQLGREGAGIVVEAGPDADPGLAGRRVIVSAYPPCGRCDRCARGLINVCRNFRRPGIDVPGTYAELVAVPRGGLFLMPDELGFDDAACLQLGLGTAWHALFRRGGLQPADRVLITGAGGGVGSALVQLAVLAGARVVAAAGNDERRALASRLGAEWVVASGAHLAEGVRAAVGEEIDLVVDAGGGDALAQGISVLRPGGRYVLYGAHGGEHVDVDLIGLFRSYTSVISSRGWLLDDMRRVIETVAAGRIDVAVTTRSFDETASAHRDLGERRVAGKLALHP